MKTKHVWTGLVTNNYFISYVNGVILFYLYVCIYKNLYPDLVNFQNISIISVVMVSCKDRDRQSTFPCKFQYYFVNKHYVSWEVTFNLVWLENYKQN